MLLNVNIDPADHSSCALSYDEQECWLQAIWRGYVNPAEALHGAEAYLLYAAQQPCAYLFNDNSRLQGPWFESLDWLLRVWVPQAQRLGLRHVAHVVQADQHHDIFTDSTGIKVPFELQIFQDREDALHWLRQVRDADQQSQSDQPVITASSYQADNKATDEAA